MKQTLLLLSLIMVCRQLRTGTLVWWQQVIGEELVENFLPQIQTQECLVWSAWLEELVLYLMYLKQYKIELIHIELRIKMVDW